MIRAASPSIDLVPILDLAKQFAAQIDYPQEFDYPSAHRTLMLCFQSQLVGVAVAQNDDGNSDVVGFVAAVAMPMIFSPVLQATEMAFYIDPKHRGEGRQLLEWLEDKALSIGCVYNNMIALQCMDEGRAGVLYERMGYKLVERFYRKEL